MCSCAFVLYRMCACVCVCVVKVCAYVCMFVCVCVRVCLQLFVDGCACLTLFVHD